MAPSKPKKKSTAEAKPKKAPRAKRGGVAAVALPIIDGAPWPMLEFVAEHRPPVSERPPTLAEWEHGAELLAAIDRCFRDGAPEAWARLIEAVYIVEAVAARPEAEIAKHLKRMRDTPSFNFDAEAVDTLAFYDPNFAKLSPQDVEREVRKKPGAGVARTAVEGILVALAMKCGALGGMSHDGLTGVARREHAASLAALVKKRIQVAAK